MTAQASVWMDGALVPAAEARVSAFDHGLTVGDGVFETMRVYRGVPFALRRHLERLERSAAGLGLSLPTRQALLEACRQVVDASGLTEARLRLTVTGGIAPLGSGRSGGRPTVMAAVAPLDTMPETAAVVVVPWRRNEHGALVGLKTTSYAENVVALAHARRSGAHEAVFANTAGRLCEGTGTNVFLAVGGRLVTPPLSSGCLAGVTRALVVERGGVDEVDVAVEALAEADEAFLTSSTREVQPVHAVTGRLLPAAPGPLTRQAMDVWTELVRTDLDP